MKVKKIITVLSAITLMFSIYGCQNTDDKNTSSNISTTNEELIKLTNSMTEKEKSSISIGELSLLEEKSDNADDNADNTSAADEPVVGIEMWTPESWTEFVEEQEKDLIDTPEYDKEMASFNDVLAILELGQTWMKCATIDGEPYKGKLLPSIDYDGGEASLSIADDEGITTNLDFESFDEVLVWYKDECNKQATAGTISQEEADKNYSDTLIIWNSVINNTYVETSSTESTQTFEWEFDVDELTEIKDSVQEISIYDEEMDSNFIVHVTLPPNYDETKTYPMFVMTDGVWRFGDHPALRKMMENGEAEDVILVSIGYNFDIDGTDNSIRGKYFCEEKEQFLKFITDNLAPYLSEIYNISFEKSGLYGHSLGGVFTHYAAFNSDLFENQPFQYYIIGSPAFWSPYFLPYEEDVDAFKSEYNYFDRNNTLNKTLYVCGGENEDPDYEEYYGENDTTLEGIDNFMNRLDGYGVTTAECKIYENSNHYEYIPSMFKTFFLEYYGKK